jgi:hypothetical protein
MVTSGCREVGAGSSATTAVSQIHGLAGCWCIPEDLLTTTRVCLLLKERGTSWSHSLTHRRAGCSRVARCCFRVPYKNHLFISIFFFHLFLRIEESRSADVSDLGQSAKVLPWEHFVFLCQRITERLAWVAEITSCYASCIYKILSSVNTILHIPTIHKINFNIIFLPYAGCGS